MGEGIVVASGKGGVGKTVFAANMGACLAQKGASVVLVDMNMGLRNLDICLGLESRVVYDVVDVLNGVCRIKQALVRDRRFPELYLMSAAQYKDVSELTPLHMSVLCKKLKNLYDYVVVDAPAGIDDSMRLAAAGADRAVVITTPEFAAVRDADMVDRVLTEMRISRRSCVINKVKAELFGRGLVPSIAEIAETLRMPLTGVIQYDENIHIAANNGMPIVFKQGTYVEQNFTQIIGRILAL